MARYVLNDDLSLSGADQLRVVESELNKMFAEIYGQNPQLVEYTPLKITASSADGTYDPATTTHRKMNRMLGELSRALGLNFVPPAYVPDALFGRETIRQLNKITAVLYSDHAADDRATFTISDKVTKAEGNDGRTGFVFLVERTERLDQTQTLDWRTGGAGTNQAMPDDFEYGFYPTGTLLFPAGVTNAQITVWVKGDTELEPNEDFFIQILNAMPAADFGRAISGGTITNDEADGLPPPTASYAISANITKNEGNSGTTAYDYLVYRTGRTDNQSSIAWAVSADTDSGSPAQANDFVGDTFQTGALVFMPGETQKGLTVNVKADTDVEPTENFKVTISNPNPFGNITRAVAGGVIGNDDVVEGNDPVITPNPLPEATTIAGPINSLPATYAGSTRNFVSGTVVDGYDLTVMNNVRADGSGGGLQFLNGSKFQGTRKNADGTTEAGYPNYNSMPAEMPSYTPFPFTFYSALGTDGVVRVNINDVEVWTQDVSQYLENGDFNGHVQVYGGGDSQHPFTLTNVRYGVVGSGVPLRIRETTFLSGFTPRGVLEYTGSPKKIRVRMENSSGGVITPYEDVVYISNAKGLVEVKGQTALPNATSFYGAGIQIRWTTFDVNGAEIDSKTQTVLMPGRAAQFGFNVHGADSPYEGFNVFQDLAVQAYWQRAHDAPNNPNGTVITDDFGNPTAVGDQRQIATGPTSSPTVMSGDNILEATWTQDSGIDATWASRIVGGNIQYGQVVVTGARKIEWREVFDRSTAGLFGGLKLQSFVEGGLPKNLSIRVKGSPPNQIYSDAFMELQQSVRGPIRFLDPRKINENHYANLDFAGRTTLNKRLKWTSDGMPLEWMIALCNATGRDMWFNSPGWYQDDYYIKTFKALDTGEGLNTTDPNADMWRNGLLPNLVIYNEWINEVWNFAFGAFSHAMQKYCERTGATEPPANDGTRVYDLSMREHAFQHNRVMTLMEATIPNYNTRCVRVVGCQLGGGHYQGLKDRGIAHYDAVAQAPYAQLSRSDLENLPDKSPATLKPIYMQKCVNVMNYMLSVRDLAKSEGKRYITYEGGPDFFGATSGMTNEEVRTFKESLEFLECQKYYYGRWPADFGDVFMQYTDTGATWGVIENQGSTKSRGLQAIHYVQENM